MVFSLKSEYQPAGDQPRAIEALVHGLKKGERDQTLLGVTGSGKTFSIANVITQVQKPTLVIAHNKTLAAQLAAEYRDFFPDAAVQYFVSYYDFYQPEAYVPTSDTYIEKEAQINEDIERLRHASTQALLTRNDVIVVASVSCIYGLGSPVEYEKVNLKITQGTPMTRASLTRALIASRYERTAGDLSPGTFRALGSRIEVMPPSERTIYRIDLSGGSVHAIEDIDAMTREIRGTPPAVFLFPAKHYVTPQKVVDLALADIEAELKMQLKKFAAEGKILEAERLKRRTKQDLAMIREFGYCNGIENYSRHFDRRKSGEPPYSLLDYFKAADKDFLVVIDESHVTVPQLGAMYAGDRARKNTLVEHGFRLPSAVDNRPLTFEEFRARTGQTIYTSATPSSFELERSGTPIEMVVRPTGLLDPEITVRPVVSGGSYAGQLKDFIAEAEATTKRGLRSLTTVLTKKMAEDLTTFLVERNVRARYLHSDVETLDRIQILTDFRRGEFDVLVGVNLLREGLDLPEVELVGILDADKEGFLRSETSLIQTIGRAARNQQGRVILYADRITPSLERAIGETNRRRAIQKAHNETHGVTPQTVAKKIKDIMGDIARVRERAVLDSLQLDALAEPDVEKLLKAKRREMHKAADALDFETAAILRDELQRLEKEIADKKSKPAVKARKQS
jgi:excinuclease ABC subunit B